MFQLENLIVYFYPFNKDDFNNDKLSNLIMPNQLAKFHKY